MMPICKNVNEYRLKNNGAHGNMIIPEHYGSCSSKMFLKVFQFTLFFFFYLKTFYLLKQYLSESWVDATLCAFFELVASGIKQYEYYFFCMLFIFIRHMLGKFKRTENIFVLQSTARHLGKLQRSH